MKRLDTDEEKEEMVRFLLKRFNDREEEKCLIIKRWFGEDIPGGHDYWDFCSKIERRENDENN